MYIIVGYAFLNTLHFVALKEKYDNIEHILTGSLVIGFIFYKIADLLPFSLGAVIDCIGITLFAVTSAYLIGRLLNSRIILEFYNGLKIRDSGKKYFWDDIMDYNIPMEVYIYYENIEYTGYLFNYESYSNHPYVVLASYISSINGKIVEDNSQDSTKVIILNTEKATKVEIVYNEKSEICNVINLFCKDRINRKQES